MISGIAGVSGNLERMLKIEGRFSDRGEVFNSGVAFARS